METKYYLGTGKKKNGSYKLEVSTKPKKTWAQWMEFSEIEATYYIALKKLHLEARSAGNLPDELNLLARINEIRSHILEQRKTDKVSYIFSEAVCDSTLF